MAAGAAPAPEKKLESKNEAAETSRPQAMTLKQRILQRLHQIFQGHDEYLGWRQ
jgi:hypothetical protein